MGILRCKICVCLLLFVAPRVANAFVYQCHVRGARPGGRRAGRLAGAGAAARGAAGAAGVRVGAAAPSSPTQTTARSGAEIARMMSGDNCGNPATHVARHATTRAGFLELAGAAVLGTLAINVAPCSAAARTTTELVRLLCDAKKQLDPVDQMIDDAKWDAIRNIIKTSPLADIKNVVAELAKQADDDESALLLGLRQDVLDHIQYLDSFSYNNVFVGEERQILGTKIDFDTPRMELRQAREAFDVILEVLPPGDD